MSDEEFLELMHLYIDGELQGPDLERLENELRANATRRALYREHCRIHAAIRRHYGALPAGGADRIEANLHAIHEKLGIDDGKVIAFPVRWVKVGGAVAAALVLGFVAAWQFGGFGSDEASAERPPLAMRETHTIQAPIASFFASEHGGVDLSDPRQRPFSLVNASESGASAVNAPAAARGVFIQQFQVEIQRAASAGPDNIFGFRQVRRVAPANVFRSGPIDDPAEEEVFRLEPLGYHISR